MRKKIIYILLTLIIVAGAIMTYIKGFNVDTMYTNNVRLYVYIQKEFENNDIKQIAKEVFGTDEIVVQKVEIYKDMAVITIKQKDVNNINAELKDLVEQLNTKVQVPQLNIPIIKRLYWNCTIIKRESDCYETCMGCETVI